MSNLKKMLRCAAIIATGFYFSASIALNFQLDVVDSDNNKLDYDLQAIGELKKGFSKALNPTQKLEKQGYIVVIKGDKFATGRCEIAFYSYTGEDGKYKGCFMQKDAKPSCLVESSCIGFNQNVEANVVKFKVKN